MLALGTTIKGLRRNQRLWNNLNKLSAKAAAPTAWHGQDAGRGMPGASASHLREVADFGSNPGALRMFAYVPARPTPPTALVVVLHGCQQTAAGYDIGAGWSTLAERYGFALLLPEQRPANNPNGCFNWFVPGDTARGGGEALSIRQMVERMLVEHGIDRSRVYVTGLSAGGAMTSVMLATYPEVFAAGAIIAGLPYGAAGTVQEALEGMFQGRAHPASEWGDRVRAASPHAGPWPRVSVWHGSADATVKPINAGEIVKQWSDLHGTGAAPAAEEFVDGYRRQVWRDAAGTDVIESYSITGMAHGTPLAIGDGADSHGQAGAFLLDVGIASSFHIAKFWGLTEGSAAPAPAPAPSPDRRVVLRAAAAPADENEEKGVDVSRLPPASDEPAPGFDVQAVINRALKAAGLIKH